ncbi:MAG: hypothetical protein IJI71_00860 [Clostridia bacterium]|nr:hypothetical protein [Clostridia bacterium]
MAKLDIYGGLLGAGKTTLIRAMLLCAYRGKRVAMIENEIGRVNLDAGAFSGVTVRPLTAGCVCCILKGDLVTAVRELFTGRRAGVHRHGGLRRRGPGGDPPDLCRDRRGFAEPLRHGRQRPEAEKADDGGRRILPHPAPGRHRYLPEFHGGSSPDGARRGQAAAAGNQPQRPTDRHLHRPIGGGYPPGGRRGHRATDARL